VSFPICQSILPFEDLNEIGIGEVFVVDIEIVDEQIDLVFAN
jgi:hypothetical protein